MENNKEINSDGKPQGNKFRCMNNTPIHRIEIMNHLHYYYIDFKLKYHTLSQTITTINAAN